MHATATTGPRAWILAVGLAAVAVAVAVMLVVTLATNSTSGLLGDLDIYRGAVQTALAGQDLYSYTYVHPTVHGLGFTYPPFAALVLVPFALLDSVSAKVVWTALTFVVTVGCIYLLVRTSGRGVVAGSPSGTHRAAWVAGLSIPVMLSYPFLHNLVVGQVSLFVIALALFDHLLPRRWQGSLVGIAAAIKLTPLVFLPYYVLTKQWRQAAVCTGAFIGATGLAWLVLPAASVSYWTNLLWQTGRVGRTDSTVNKSLLGLLARQLPDGVPTTPGLAGRRSSRRRARVLAGRTAPAGRQPARRNAGRREPCRLPSRRSPGPTTSSGWCWPRAGTSCWVGARRRWSARRCSSSSSATRGSTTIRRARSGRCWASGSNCRRSPSSSSSVSACCPAGGWRPRRKLRPGSARQGDRPALCR